MSDDYGIPSDESTISDLQLKLDAWEVRHFTANELIQLDDPQWDGPRMPVPPANLWPNMRDTVLLADQLRKRWGGAIVVTSGWRPLPYNRLVGSSDDSAHPDFRALDLKPVGRFDLSSYFNTVARVVRQARSAGLMVGCGLYYERRGRFCHLDTGHADYQRNWSRPAGQEVDSLDVS